jgi:hypothetical protein
VITETFGENKTYINQVFLLEFNPLNIQEHDEETDEENEIEQNNSQIYEEVSGHG